MSSVWEAWCGGFETPDALVRALTPPALTVSLTLPLPHPAHPLCSWFKLLLDGTSRPTFSWNIDAASGAITVTTKGQQPVAVVNRMSTTLDGYRRDFRLVSGDTPANPCKFIPVPVFGSACLRPIVWIGNTIGPASTVGDVQTWVATQDAPAVGWRAWLVELYFNSTIPGLLQQYTTQVSILPAPGTPLYPFPLCKGAQCQGDLV